MKTSAAGLYAAGDVATYKAASGKAQRIEHWDVAFSQGRVAGRNMNGKNEDFDATPFFWTSLFGKNLRCVGTHSGYDELIVDGSIDSLKFVGYYCSKGRIVSVVTMNRDPVAVAVGEMMRQGMMPSAEAVRAPGFSSDSLVDAFRNGALGAAKTK